MSVFFSAIGAWLENGVCVRARVIGCRFKRSKLPMSTILASCVKQTFEILHRGSESASLPSSSPSVQPHPNNTYGAKGTTRLLKSPSVIPFVRYFCNPERSEWLLSSSSEERNGSTPNDCARPDSFEKTRNDNVLHLKIRLLACQLSTLFGQHDDRRRSVSKHPCRSSLEHRRGCRPHTNSVGYKCKYSISNEPN